MIQSNAFYNFVFKSTSLLSKAYYLVILSLLSSKVCHILGVSTGRVLKKKLIIDKFYGQVRSTDMYGIIRGCR